MFQYKQLAEEFETKIHNGTYPPGERLPSIRKLHRQLNLSISTVYQAYVELETSGLIEARPKSGYYVTPVPLRQLKAPVFEKKAAETVPRKVELSSMVYALVKAANDPNMLPLGCSATSPELLPYKALARILKGFTNNEIRSMISYPLTEGIPELRRQLVLQYIGVLKKISPEDIIITNGCIEAISLCLKALTNPGDTIAIETPTFFGFLQVLKEMGLMVVEVPTDPRYGVDLDELENTFRRNDIKACLFIPNFHNPLGALMPDSRKQKLVELVTRYGIPLIEDDISSELCYGEKRPLPLKAFDRKDMVLTCSSFSKTLAPGFRIGWAIPGKRFREKMLHLKTGINISTAGLNQHVLCRFLSGGGYNRHLRSLRNAVKKQTTNTALAIRKYFPPDIRLAIPQGGALLWVQLPQNIDGLDVYRKAMERRISILPGSVCTISGSFKNYIRICSSSPFTPAVEKGIATLGELICGMLDA